MQARVHVLMYGDYFDLHERITKSLRPITWPVRVWCNTVCKRTEDMLRESKWDVTFSKENVPKYKVMAKLFAEDLPEWVVWFDDDAYVTASDWQKKLSAFVDGTPNAAYIGQKWFVHHLPGQREFIEAASWYRGVPWEMCPTRTPGVKRPGITFAQGSFWALRTDLLRELKWPDPRLSHNGGDTLLGEAVRQSGHAMHQFHYGVKLNDAKRRGISDKPAGSTVDTRR